MHFDPSWILDLQQNGPATFAPKQERVQGFLNVADDFGCMDRFVSIYILPHNVYQLRDYCVVGNLSLVL